MLVEVNLHALAALFAMQWVVLWLLWERQTGVEKQGSPRPDRGETISRLSYHRGHGQVYPHTEST